MDDIAKVRKRPGMYVGDLQDGTGLHNLVLGMVTLAIGRARLHPSFNTTVLLGADAAVTVCFAGSEEWNEADVEILARARVTAATSIMDGIQLEAGAFDVAAGVYCDLCAVNALSDWVCDQVWSGTVIRKQMFRDGSLETNSKAPLLLEVISHGQSGFSTSFLPSDKIFPSISFDTERLQASLSDLCAQNVGARVSLVDGR